MYLILMPSTSTDRGNDVEKFDTREKLGKFLLDTKRDLARMEIFEVRPLRIDIALSGADYVR